PDLARVPFREEEVVDVHAHESGRQLDTEQILTHETGTHPVRETLLLTVTLLLPDSEGSSRIRLSGVQSPDPCRRDLVADGAIRRLHLPLGLRLVGMRQVEVELVVEDRLPREIRTRRGFEVLPSGAVRGEH